MENLMFQENGKFYYESWALCDKVRSSKLDYSKVKIGKFLLKEFGLDSDLIVNNIYEQLLNDNSLSNQFSLTLASDNSLFKTVKGKIKKSKTCLKFDNMPKFKVNRQWNKQQYVLNYSQYRLTSTVNRQVNFMEFMFIGYKSYNVDFRDLKQDLLYRYYKYNLRQQYIDNCKNRIAKHKHVYSFKKFLFYKFHTYFLASVNTYMYTVDIPERVKRQFTRKHELIKQTLKENIYLPPVKVNKPRLVSHQKTLTKKAVKNIKHKSVVLERVNTLERQQSTRQQYSSQYSVDSYQYLLKASQHAERQQSFIDIDSKYYIKTVYNNFLEYLNESQIDILNLLLEGLTNKQIAINQNCSLRKIEGLTSQIKRQQYIYWWDKILSIKASKQLIAV